MFRIFRELQSANAQIKIYQERIEELQRFLDERNKHINAVGDELRKERDKNEVLVEVLKRIDMFATQSNDATIKVYMKKIKEITRDILE